MWLREVLNEFGLVSRDQAIGTHSAKATVLSWMCKAHAPGDLQRLAGYHVDPNSKSALEYSRDGQAPVVHFIEGLLLTIFSEMFLPDSTRAGRWVGCRSLDQALQKLSKAPNDGAGDESWHPSGAPESDRYNLFGGPDLQFENAGPLDEERTAAEDCQMCRRVRSLRFSCTHQTRVPAVTRIMRRMNATWMWLEGQSQA